MKTAEFANRFQRAFPPGTRVFRAPGRVNLIGEHTDYNDGFVLPAAIDLATYVAAEPRNDRMLFIESENFGECSEFPLDDSSANPRGDWTDYVRGVAVLLQRSGHSLRGASLTVRGDIPIGSGLSSSAALEVAAAQALLAVSGLKLPPRDLAKLCQRTENEFVGVNCGIMDQFACTGAHAGCALLLDCRSLDYRIVPLHSAACLMICDTKVRHELKTDDYNQRRAECQQGVRLLQSHNSAIRSLRDAKLESLAAVELPEIILRRCRHVITENARVLAAAQALESGDLNRAGTLMHESHKSLRDDYQVSCAELDLMVQIAGNLPGVYGSRMTGAGFGGCTINLVQSEHAAEFARSVSEQYQRVTGIEPRVWCCQAGEGASEIPYA